MGPIIKLLRKTKMFAWIAKCQKLWEAIKQRYLDAPILITLKWDMEFHIHTNASNLAIGVMLAQNPIEKCDQPIAYASRLLNNAEKNYITTKKEAIAMDYVTTLALGSWPKQRHGKVWVENATQESHTPKWTPILEVRIPMESRIFKEIF